MSAVPSAEGSLPAFRDTAGETASERIRLRAQLLDSVGQAVIATDIDGRILYWNPAARELYGWSAEEVLGRSILEVTPAETTQEQAAEIMACLRAGQTWTGEFPVRRKDGTTFLAMVTDTAVRDARGSLVGVVGVSWDLTERMAAERQVKAAFEQANRAVEDRDRVLAFVSHDLRNPLHTIMMANALLLEDLPEAKKAAQVSIIGRAARQMARLIEDLLDVARIDGDRLSIAPEPCDSGELVSAAVDLLQSFTESRGVELRGEACRAVAVMADRERIIQVFTNLVGNAADHTEAGGSVVIRSNPISGGCRFTVQDSGRGIRAEDVPRVFDRFWRGQRPGGSGAGLGLAIVKGIVEAHRGEIWVESELGVGTSFHFTLPAD
jgi:PAS domain S-box-containing protein